jgi:hypothetical protein
MMYLSFHEGYRFIRDGLLWTGIVERYRIIIKIALRFLHIYISLFLVLKVKFIYLIKCLHNVDMQVDFFFI